MFDTMTVTKAGGALCGSLLVFLLANWAGSALYSTTIDSHGDEVVQAFIIDTGKDDDDDADDDDADELDFAALVEAGDADAGQKVFGKCKACHKVDGGNATGPHLDGVIDRAKGSVDGFKYSTPMAGLTDEAWTIEDLDAFLLNPKGEVPGTKMSFAGLPKVQDRANVIKYLIEVGG